MTRSSEEETGGGWVSREIEAMVAAWQRGAPATAHDALDGRPDVDSESAIRLIYEETCLRREAGQHVETTDVVARFPRWGTELRGVLECDRLIQSPRGYPDYPEAGELLGPFLLLAELGRGTAGRTFLASEPTLADRPVVVKVIRDDQDEHLALARLRHTHIVPLFSEHAFPERGLRGLCMPFLGGASFARILDDLADVPFEHRTGQLVVKVIDRHTRLAPPLIAADGPFRRTLERASYGEALVWIVACLAEALHYSHARGLIHMDIKPSNALITMDGQPMLLDFHLAQGPILAGERGVIRLGGTPGWMSPEQDQAMAAIREGCSIPATIDGRSDIFALGLLLGRALGALPKPQPGGDVLPALRRTPGMSVGLYDILKKCLAPRPADRYADAANLAEDLRRELNSLPLKGVRNRSPRERFWKWRRRHPGALAWCVAGLLISLAAALALSAFLAVKHERVARIRLLLDDGRRDRASRHYAEAVETLERGLESARIFPAREDLAESLRRELRLAERGWLAAELHELADRIRTCHSIELPSPVDAESLLRLCRAFWGRKDQLLAGDTPAADDTGRMIRTDLLELAAITADIRVRHAPADALAEARADALRLLGEAESTCGPSFAIDARRDALAGPPPRAAKARSGLVPGSAWEYYELGRYDLRSGRLEPAAEAFQHALDLKPQDFWSNFYHGLASYRLGHFGDALADFRACITIEPRSAAAHYNGALAFEAVGRTRDARQGYTRAIELSPGLAAARLNRGILWYQSARYTDAAADFAAGLAAGPDRELSGRFHFNLALAQLGLHDRASARSNAERAAELGCREADVLLDELR